MSSHSPHKPGSIPPPPQPPPKPGVALVSDMHDGDHFELRLPIGVRRDYFAAWLCSDSFMQAYAAWLEARQP